MTQEACVACGCETATGTPYYPGRLHVERPDGTPIFLCRDCSGMVRSGGLTELVRRGELPGLDEWDLLRLRDALPPTGLLATVGRR